MTLPQLAYWDIRGVGPYQDNVYSKSLFTVNFYQLAQPIRLLLAYTGTEFEDKYYVCGPAPTFDKSCWFDIKFSLGLDFPNVIKSDK